MIEKLSAIYETIVTLYLFLICSGIVDLPQTYKSRTIFSIIYDRELRNGIVFEIESSHISDLTLLLLVSVFFTFNYRQILFLIVYFNNFLIAFFSIQ